MTSGNQKSTKNLNFVQTLLSSEFLPTRHHYLK